jgi:hypothetical protein
MGDGLREEGKLGRRMEKERAREREGLKGLGFYFILKICFLFDFKTGFENNL